MMFLFFLQQDTSYDMRISDWSSDVCSSDLDFSLFAFSCHLAQRLAFIAFTGTLSRHFLFDFVQTGFGFVHASDGLVSQFLGGGRDFLALLQLAFDLFGNRLNRVQLQIERSFHLSGNLCRRLVFGTHNKCRSEEHTSELQSLMRISYAVFCLQKKIKKDTTHVVLLHKQ